MRLIGIDATSAGGVLFSASAGFKWFSAKASVALLLVEASIVLFEMVCGEVTSFVDRGWKN